MKSLLKTVACLIIVSSLQVSANPIDHLALLQAHGGAKAFCNMLNRAQQLPETDTSCVAIIAVKNSPTAIDEIKNGEFGQPLKISKFGSSSNLVIAVVTIEQLEVLRFDSRIINLAPDFSLGGVGGFSSAGGGK